MGKEVILKNPGRKGREKEQLIVRNAKAKGLIAARTAASRGPFDVIIIDKENRKITLVQSKAGSYMTAKMCEDLYKENEGLTGVFEVEYQIW